MSTVSVIGLVLAAVPAILFAGFEIRVARIMRNLPDTLGSGNGRTWKRKAFLRVVAALFGAAGWVAAVLAASGSVQVRSIVRAPVGGGELVFAIDASNSMLTVEGGTERLDRAVDFAARLADAVGTADLGLVAFRGLAVTLCPVTAYRRAFDNALGYVTPALTTTPGTDLAGALKQAAAGAAGRVRLVVLLSDGNDTADTPATALRQSTDSRAVAEAARLAEKGASLLVVGFGSASPVPVPDATGNLVRAADGTVVRTGQNETALRSLAGAAGGVYVDGDAPGALARATAAALEALPGDGRSVRRVETREATSGLSLLALVCFSLSLLLTRVPDRQHWPARLKPRQLLSRFTRRFSRPAAGLSSGPRGGVS